MEIEIKDKPRCFKVGADLSIEIKDCGEIFLEPDEQVTFKTVDGAETDFTRKNWGFYAAGSLNGRLQEHGFKPALLVNRLGKFYIMFVEKNKDDLFLAYIRKEENRLICWLDENSLTKIDTLFNA